MLLLIMAILVLYGLYKVTPIMFVKHGQYLDKRYEEILAAERQEIYDNFEYVRESDYEILAKTKDSIVNPFSQELTEYYYLDVQDENEDYRLEVPKEMYETVQEDERILFKEGKDTNYMLSKEGNVIIKIKVDKQGE